VCPWVLEHRGESAGEVARSTSTTPGAPIHSRRFLALAASGSPRRRPARQCAAEVSPLAQCAPFATAASAGRTDQRTAASPGSDSAGRYSATIAIRPSQQRADGRIRAPRRLLLPRSSSPTVRSCSSSAAVVRSVSAAAPAHVGKAAAACYWRFAGQGRGRGRRLHRCNRGNRTNSRPCTASSSPAGERGGLAQGGRVGRHREGAVHCAGAAAALQVSRDGG
jgi:hypothetical protein